MLYCNACGAEYHTEPQRLAHLNTVEHLIASRNMWREFLEHPARKGRLSARTLKEAQECIAEIDKELAMLKKKAG